MSSKKLKIAHIAAEVEPFTKSGGLADVSNSLPRAVKKLGHKNIVITPLYRNAIKVPMKSLKPVASNVKLELSDGISTEVNYWVGELERGLPVYFVDHMKYFGKRKTLYGSKHENARFFLFDLAALKLLKLIDFRADVIHCHDWHSGLVPYFLARRFKKDPFFEKTASLFTIHNLLFQFGHDWWKVRPDLKDDGYDRIPSFGHTTMIERVNFAKRAIINADIINAVSEQYAQEIMTRDFGQDLHRVLINRKNRLYGIVNGIDYDDYNPRTDPGLKTKYSYDSLHKKAVNKKALQKYFKLPQRTDVPVLGMVTRIAEQKGIDLVMAIIDDVLRLDVQFVIMGSGEKKYINFFEKMAKKHPKKIGTHLKFNTKHATSVYAGSDMFLMPSRFEPCGLGQLISLRYGSIPVVRAVGGLSDTVTDFNPKTGNGNGFVFHTYNSKALLVSIVRAVENYKYEKVWERLVVSGMKQSFSWEIPAKKYVALYRKSIKQKRENSNGKNGKNGK